jgi:hypothetical protein
MQELGYGSFTLQESHFLDIFGCYSRGGGSLFFHRALVERQASFTDDTSRAGRARHRILADVEEYA